MMSREGTFQGERMVHHRQADQRDQTQSYQRQDYRHDNGQWNEHGTFLYPQNNNKNNVNYNNNKYGGGKID
ncbi:hypothetical protein DFA_04469 [Cavenderia fasciculata]|uniref:Uncharacterized protein n=1 Tax=Cavenderia fasciculata TaxID=261658 RepID=F4PPN8_CACFS|nr:uncharacterized protein DFA_04469 [Cavenderia fasciculata]EGG22351.1 hypothetical protein DFA_04469 [Cavenderia fasciculata]|eukprot:XP_004360202.1 hypothetical protein DFA_04469 [Cavenderia fasciculata]